MRSICRTEIDFIKSGLKKGYRLDGRQESQVRRFKLNSEAEILKTANGACMLTLGSSFSILVGIKAGKPTSKILRNCDPN